MAAYRDKIFFKSKYFSLGVLLLILVGGAALRFLGLFHGVSFHPDERHMVMVTSDLDPRKSLNPKSFAYGSFPYYLNRFIGEFLALIGFGEQGYDQYFIIGRSISILFGLVTIVLVYIFARRIFKNDLAGLLAATFISFNPLHIQLSRFFAVDAMLAAIALAATMCMVRLGETGKFSWALLSGAMIGLAVGTKFSGILLLSVLGAALLLYIIKFGISSWPRFLILGIVAISAMVVTSFIVEPYAFLEFKEFWKQVSEQINMAKGEWQPPYTIQYEGTTPYLYPLIQMFNYTMGAPIFVLVGIGVVLGIYSIIKDLLSLKIENYGLVLSILWIVALFGTTAGLLVKYPRYLLPIYPHLFVVAGGFLAKFGLRTHR